MHEVGSTAFLGSSVVRIAGHLLKVPVPSITWLRKRFRNGRYWILGRIFLPPWALDCSNTTSFVLFPSCPLFPYNDHFPSLLSFQCLITFVVP